MMRARRATKLTRGSFNSKAHLTTLAEDGDEEEEDDIEFTGNSKKHLNLRDIKGRSSISESKNTSMLDGYSLRDEDRRETGTRDSFDFGIGNLGLGSRTNSLIWSHYHYHYQHYHYDYHYYHHHYYYYYYYHY